MILFLINVLLLLNWKNSVGVLFYNFEVVFMWLIIFINMLLRIFIVLMGMFLWIILMVMFVVVLIVGKVIIVMLVCLGMGVSLRVVFVMNLRVFFDLINSELRLYLVEDFLGFLWVLRMVLLLRIMVRLMI